MKKLLSCCLLAMAAVVAVAAERRLSLEDYRQKMKAGWIGQIAGVSVGAPTEFRWHHQIIPAGELRKWSPAMINEAFHQDDLYVEMTFLRTLETRGAGISQREAAIDFANSQYRLWHGNAEGRNNLRSGIAPPDSAHPKFNTCANDIDYQIEADYSGIVSPGMRQGAIDLGEKFGGIICHGDGLYGGQFVGALYAEAFFETNVVRIVERALEAIPPQCRYAAMVRDMLAWHREDPRDWQKAWKRLDESYGRDHGCKYASGGNIEAVVNGGMVVLGILWGDGDLERTIEISCRGGYDSDCNPSTAAGVVFTRLRADTLPKKFMEALDEKTKFEYTAYNVPGLVAASEKVAREMVVAQGGRIERDAAGSEWFVLPERPLRLSPLVSRERPGPVVGSRFTPEEMERIRFLPEDPAKRAVDIWSFWGQDSVAKPVTNSAGNAVAKWDRKMAVDKVAATEAIRWIDGRELPIEGRAFDNVGHYYDRLPSNVTERVNGGVRMMKHHTAGMQFRFRTDSSRLVFRWGTFFKELSMDHMPASGVSGIDVYRFDESRQRWLYVATGRCVRQATNVLEVAWKPGDACIVNLPLYNGIASFELGVDEAAEVKALAPRKSGVDKPVVFYGTSITHGGCCSRPGLAFVSIVGRDLDVPVVNLGFSGSGRGELEMSDHLAAIDASCYVIDCVWNMDAQLMAKRYEKFVRNLRAKRPEVPVVLVEPCDVYCRTEQSKFALERGTLVRPTYEKLCAEGWDKLVFLPADGQFADDFEGTVDGVHPNDCGMMHLASAFDAAVRLALTSEAGGVVKGTDPRTPLRIGRQ